MKFRKTNRNKKTIRKRRTIRKRKTNRNKKMIGGGTPLTEEQKTYLKNMQFELPSGTVSFPDRIKSNISAHTTVSVETIDFACKMNKLTDLATLMTTYPQGTVIPPPHSRIYLTFANFYNGYSTGANDKSYKSGETKP